MFRIVPLSIIRSFSLYTQQWYMSYRFADSFRAGSGCSALILLASCQQTCMTYTVSLLCVQWKTPDDGTRNCPKHVEFHSKNKCEKLVHLVGFIIRIYHDARSAERQIFFWGRRFKRNIFYTRNYHFLVMQQKSREMECFRWTTRNVDFFYMDM